MKAFDGISFDVTLNTYEPGQDSAITLQKKRH
jgi:hypothetical protein